MHITASEKYNPIVYSRFDSEKLASIFASTNTNKKKINPIKSVNVISCENLFADLRMICNTIT